MKEVADIVWVGDPYRGVRRNRDGTARNARWRCEAFPGVAILHCCHPTANRPYYVIGVPGELELLKLSTLAAAQAAVREHLLVEAP